MKICSPQLGLDPNSTLGGEVHDHHILQGLAKRGHKIFVYLPKGRPYQKHKNIIVERAPFKHIPAFAFNFIALSYIFRTYNKERFAILRIHSPYYLGIAAFIFKIFHPNVPIVTTYHLKEEGLLFDWTNKIFAKNYNMSIAVSNFVKNWLVKRYHLKNENVRVIYNGVDNDFCPQEKNKILLKKYNLENKVILFFMGRLIERKNPLFLLEVFKKLKVKYPNLALLVCGEGPLEEKIKDMIKRQKTRNVILTGNIIGKNKIDLFNLCDIFTLPSKNEGFGLVIAEAMSCAKPTVITNGWSAKEAISNGVEGFHAKENDLTDWYEKIAMLVKDRKMRNSMGAKARQKAVEKFNWHTSVKMHENLFLKLLDNVK